MDIDVVVINGDDADSTIIKTIKMTMLMMLMMNVQGTAVAVEILLLLYNRYGIYVEWMLFPMAGPMSMFLFLLLLLLLVMLNQEQ